MRVLVVVVILGFGYVFIVEGFKVWLMWMLVCVGYVFVFNCWNSIVIY